ncbi:unnamed protein product, partial [Linum tenue]
LSIVTQIESRVIREDDSQCTKIKYSKPSTEAIEILKLFGNWKMLLIAPAAWASNFFYTYQLNNVNAAKFNVRTRGLNNVFYWGAQMVGAFAIGQVLDFSCKSKKNRGFLGIAIVGVMGTAIWGGEKGRPSIDRDGRLVIRLGVDLECLRVIFW